MLPSVGHRDFSSSYEKRKKRADIAPVQPVLFFSITVYLFLSLFFLFDSLYLDLWGWKGPVLIGEDVVTLL